MNTPILMTEDYWANSPLSIARYYGQIKIEGAEYIIVNKEGKDIFQCSYEAHKAGKEKAIEPGEPVDLVDKRYVPIYRKVGRDKFIYMIKKKMTLEQMKQEVEK